MSTSATSATTRSTSPIQLHQLHLSTALPQPLAGERPTVQANLSAGVTNPFKGQPEVTGALATASTISKLTLTRTVSRVHQRQRAARPRTIRPCTTLCCHPPLHSPSSQRPNNQRQLHLLTQSRQTAQLNQGGPLTYQENASDFPTTSPLPTVYKQLPIGHQRTSFLALSQPDRR